MEDYNFWADILDTYQSLSDWMQTLWFIVPAVFVPALFALAIRYRLAVKVAENGTGGDLVYTIRRDKFDQLHVYRHGREIEQQPTVLLLEQPTSERVEPLHPDTTTS